MNAATEQDVDREFVARLKDLVRRSDRARLAALRQLLAPPERWGPDAYAAGLPLVPPRALETEESRLLLVAGLFALWHRGRETLLEDEPRNFGTSMRTAATMLANGATLAPSIENRFSVLLSSDEERLTHHLRQAVSLCAAHDVRIGWVSLIGDLRRWSHPDRFIQRRWARAFWSPNTEHPGEETQ